MSRKATIVSFFIWLVGVFLIFYKTCSESNQAKKSFKIYQKNTSYYVSGQIFKMTEISSQRYCLFINLDSFNIKAKSPDLYYFSGIYDKENNIALLVAHLGDFDKNTKEEYPYIIAKYDYDEKIDTLISSNKNYGFHWVDRPSIVSDKFYGKFLSKQMDTMQNPIKF